MTTLSVALPADTSRTARRAGIAISALAAAFLLFDALLHVLNVQAVQDAMRTLGFERDAAIGIGVVELVCLALYLVPRTAVLGAVLLTGYLGGAVAVQLRVDAPVLSTLLFPVYVGALVWAGLWLRDARARGILARP
jgi:hypothetical protein